MKGLISGIKRMEIHDGDGIRTTVFFKGCPLKCVWCHNPESISRLAQTAKFSEKCIGCGSCEAVCEIGAIKRDSFDSTACIGCGKCAEACPTDAVKHYGEELDLQTVFEAVMQDELFFKNSSGGVTLSGGECLMQADFAIELAKRFFDSGISVNIDTSGYAPTSVLQRIMPYTDCFLYDVKAITSSVHEKCTGRGNELILKNLKFLSDNNARIEIRIPVVMGYNDGEIEAIGKHLLTLKGIKKVKLLKYHSFASSRYEALGMKNTLPEGLTSSEDLRRFVGILKEMGLNATDT